MTRIPIGILVIFVIKGGVIVKNNNATILLNAELKVNGPGGIKSKYGINTK
jgi:hypothetical protein